MNIFDNHLKEIQNLILSNKEVLRLENIDNLKNVNYCNSISSACFKSDLIIIHTEWNDFKFLDFKSLVKKTNFKIYDMRNLYSPIKMKKLKIKYSVAIN